jgi:uncharacterized coiled-coil protein SlyX
MLTVAEQEQFVRLLDNSTAEFRQSVETIMGVKLDGLTFGERLSAISNYLEQGRNAAALAQAGRAVRDVERLAQETRGEIALSDKLAIAEARIEQLSEQLAAKSQPMPAGPKRKR